MSDKAPRYQRILLKLSGEALAGKNDMGIDSGVLDNMSLAIAHLVGLGVQVGIVVGGGNLYRGAALQKTRLGGPCHRRPNGYAGDRNEWLGDA